jgi:hypothetical protein
MMTQSDSLVGKRFKKIKKNGMRTTEIKRNIQKFYREENKFRGRGDLPFSLNAKDVTGTFSIPLGISSVEASDNVFKSHISMDPSDFPTL